VGEEGKGQQAERRISEKKRCRHCETMIPLEAKVCFQCGRRQGHPVVKFVVGIILLITILFLARDFYLYMTVGPEGRGPAVGIRSSESPQASNRPNGVGPAPAPTEEPLTTSSTVLMKDYNSNEIRADKAYKGKTIVVLGRVESVSKILNQPFVMLGPLNGVFGVMCRFTGESEEMLSGLETGSVVGVVGECRGSIAGNVVISGSALLPKQRVETILKTTKPFTTSAASDQASDEEQQ
jgi:ribosomal protein L40E